MPLEYISAGATNEQNFSKVLDSSNLGTPDYDALKRMLIVFSRHIPATSIFCQQSSFQAEFSQFLFINRLTNFEMLLQVAFNFEIYGGLQLINCTRGKSTTFLQTASLCKIVIF